MSATSSKNLLFLDGYSLTPSELYQLSKGGTYIGLTEDAKDRVAAGRDVVDKVVASGEVVYGINTGFGLFSNVTIGPDKLGEVSERALVKMSIILKVCEMATDMMATSTAM